MINRLKQFIIKQMFFPGLIAGLFLNPFYFARRSLMQHIKSLAHYINGKVLDVGCGEKPYQSLFQSSNYVGLEISTNNTLQYSNPDVYYDGNKFPFKDESFDAVLSFQVFEHVFEPDRFLSEVQRVLKDQGTILLTVPFIWDEHLQPHDFARYTSYGLTALLKKYNFEIIEYRKSLNDFRIVFQIIAMYWYKKLITKNVYLNLLLYVFFFGPLNLIGLLSYIFPSNNDFYLDNIILAKKHIH